MGVHTVRGKPTSLWGSLLGRGKSTSLWESLLDRGKSTSLWGSMLDRGKSTSLWGSMLDRGRDSFSFLRVLRSSKRPLIVSYKGYICMAGNQFDTMTALWLVCLTP